MQRLELHQLPQLLAYIPADTPRDEWVLNLMAIKSEFGESGREAAQAWSSTAPSFKLADFLATWKSIKADGGRTIASLVYEAKQNGFKFAPISPQQAEKLKAEQRQRQKEKAALAKLEAEETAKRQQAVKEKAQAIIQSLSSAGNQWVNGRMVFMQPKYASPLHPYYAKKGLGEAVKHLKPVFMDNNSLIIPVQHLSNNGELETWSLQFIDPDGNKRFLKGGKLKGGFYPVRLAPNGGYVHEVVICEGYATGVTLAAYYFQHSEVICAFNAGNLKKVAIALKHRYPAARFIIAGDNDHLTEQKTGKNAGKQKAIAAAKAIGAFVCLPEFAPHEEGTDWNDRFLLDRNQPQITHSA